MDSEMEILFDFGIGASVPKRGGSRCFGKEDRFPVPSFQGRWRVGGLVLNGRRAGSLVLASALLLLGIAVPSVCAQPFTERNPAQDFNTLGVADGNKRPKGLWTDGMTMLVSDADGKIYSYDLESKQRQDSHHETDDDFVLYESGTSGKTIIPYGIWANGSTNGSTLWAVHSPPRGDTNVLVKIYAYTITNKVSDVRDDLSGDERYWTGVRDSSKDIGPLKRDDREGNATTNDLDPTGLWSDGRTMWVSDNHGGESSIYAYTISSGARDRGKDIDLSVDTGRQNAYDYTLDKNSSPQGIWSDGETMWVAEVAGATDSAEKRIYAYNMWTNSSAGVRMFDGSRVPEKDYKNLNENLNTDGDGTTNRESADNDRPRGICSDGETMWVADITDNKLYAYHAFRNTHDRNPTQDFDGLAAASNRSARGIWSDRETMWVTDDSFDKLFAYNLATKEREEGKEFTLKTSTTDNKFPQSLWSDGTTMWVSHFLWSGTESKIFAYNLSTKARDPSKDFDTLLAEGNDNPVGLWSNGTTMWVADSVDKKIYAYKMSDKSRDAGKDFNTLIRAGNENPKGIYSDGTTMWVADFDDDKIYAYKMSDKSRDAGKDFDTLKAAGNNAPFGIWSDNITTMWVLDSTDDKIYAYNTDVLEARLGRLVVKGLVPSREKEDNPNPREEDFEVKLTPLFNNGTMNYEASVPYATERLTLETKALRPIDESPTGGISYSRVGAVSNDDLENVDNDKDDFQEVDLTVGMNSFAITVTNGNKNTNSLPRSRTYRVDVTREFYTFNDPSKNIDLHADNAEPLGVWANETTLWVANDGGTTNKLYAYNLQTKLHDTSKDFTLRDGNRAPRGIWSDGTTMWVADSTFTTTEGKKKLFAYKLILKEGETDRDRRDSNKDIVLASVNAHPEWIWSDGVTMWVSDSADNKLYAYDLVSQAYDSTKDISLAEGRARNNTSPTGIWLDGNSLWIADNGTDKIYAHKINETGDAIDCWEEVRDFNTLKDAGNLNPAAIFSDRSTMYVVDLGNENDKGDERIFAYNQPLSTNNKLKSLALSGVYYGDQLFSQSFSSYETNYTNGIYVLYSTASTTVTAIAQDPDAGVNINKEDADPATLGHQINLLAEDTTEIVITVTAENAAVKEYIVKVDRRSGWHTPINDVVLRMNNSFPIGLWMNEGKTKIWVVENGNDRIYAYALGAEGTGYLPGDSFLTQLSAAGNNNPRHIWSDGTTMWVSDKDDKRIYAYKMADKSREDKEIAVSVINSTAQISGLW